MSWGQGMIIRIYIIVFNDTASDPKSEVMLLGVILDDRLIHFRVSNVCRKVCSQTGVLLRVGNLILTSAKLLIVNLLSYLMSCTDKHTVRHFCCSNSDVRKLEQI